MYEMFGALSGVMASFMPQAQGDNGDGLVVRNDAIPLAAENVEDDVGGEILRNFLVDAEDVQGVCETGVDGGAINEVDNGFLLELIEPYSAVENLASVSVDAADKKSHNVFDYLTFGPQSADVNGVKSRNLDLQCLHSQQHEKNQNVSKKEGFCANNSNESCCVDNSNAFTGVMPFLKTETHTNGNSNSMTGTCANEQANGLSHSHSISRSQIRGQGTAIDQRLNMGSTPSQSAILSAVTHGGNSNEETMEIDTDMDMDTPLVAKSTRQVKKQAHNFPQNGTRSCESKQMGRKGKDGKAPKKKKKNMKRNRKDAGIDLNCVNFEVGGASSAMSTDKGKGSSFNASMRQGGVHPSTLQDEELLLLKPKKTRKKAKFESPVASRFCHVCSRTPKNVRLAVCMKITDGVCRKVICEKCFDEYKYGNFEHAYTVKDWLCPHCSGICPERAQCRTYSRINDKLRVTRLKQPKLPRKIHAKKAASQAGAITRFSFDPNPSFPASPSHSQAPFAVAAASPSIPPVSFMSDHVSGYDASFTQARANFAVATSTANYTTAKDRRSNCGTPVSSDDPANLPAPPNEAALGAFDMKNLPTREELHALVMEPDLADVLMPSHPLLATAAPVSLPPSASSLPANGLEYVTSAQSTPVAAPAGAVLYTDAIIDNTASSEDDLNPVYYPPLLDPLVNEFVNPATW